VGYSFDISFRGPLYDGRDRSKGKVRVAVNQRSEEVETDRELVNSPYDDVRPFVVTALALEHLLAEKLRALLVRGKPRDLYDVWLLLRRGVERIRVKAALCSGWIARSSRQATDLTIRREQKRHFYRNAIIDFCTS